MSVIRVKHTDQYVVIKKTALEDKRLSFKAKGLWAYCMSRPNDWEFNVSHLSTVSKEGKEAIYSSIKELIKYGYCTKEQDRVARGKGYGRGTYARVDYTIFEEPQNSNNFSQTGFPETEDSDPKNPPQLSIDPKPSIDKELNTPIAPSEGGLVFGEYVKLTKKEYDELITFVGFESNLIELISEINDYLSSTGKKPYKDYAATIRNWWRRRKPSHQNEKKPIIETNKELSKKVVTKYASEVEKNHIQLQENSILFCYTSCFEEIFFTDNGFRDRLLSRLRKMNLDTKELK